MVRAEGVLIDSSTPQTITYTFTKSLIKYTVGTSLRVMLSAMHGFEDGVLESIRGLYDHSPMKGR